MPEVFVGSLVGALMLNTIIAVLYRKRMLARLAGDPVQRAKILRGSIAGGWGLAGLVVLAVDVAGDDLSLADVGWTWSTGGHLGLTPEAGAAMTWLLTAGVLALTTASIAQTRRSVRAGRPVQIRPEIALMLPRTPQERRLITGVAFTAGVTEEVVYRGFLIGAVVTVLDQPPVLAVALSLVLFVAGHAYQGRQGMSGVSAAGLVLTLFYLLSGSILPGIVAHVFQDLAALLMLPPATATSPVPQPALTIPARPTETQPTTKTQPTTGARPELATEPPGASSPDAVAPPPCASPHIRPPSPQ